jgi:hypothetical protein
MPVVSPKRVHKITGVDGEVSDLLVFHEKEVKSPRQQALLEQ